MMVGRRRRAQLAEVDLLDGMSGEEGGGDLVGVLLEVAGQVGVVGHEHVGAGQGEGGVLEGDELLDEELGFLE